MASQCRASIGSPANIVDTTMIELDYTLSGSDTNVVPAAVEMLHKRFGGLSNTGLRVSKAASIKASR
jgi:hypothetical protein